MPPKRGRNQHLQGEGQRKVCLRRIRSSSGHGDHLWGVGESTGRGPKERDKKGHIGRRPRLGAGIQKAGRKAR